VFGEAHSLGKGDAEPVKKRDLGGIGLGDAAQPDPTVRGGRQHDVVGQNARELLEHGARQGRSGGGERLGIAADAFHHRKEPV